MTTFPIKNSVAFVTGTSRKNGIGRAIVKALIDKGATKVYATARKAEQLDDLVAEYPTKVVAVELDVTDFAAVDKVAESYPDVNLLINNAGYLSGENWTGDLAEIQREIAVNYLGPLAVGKSFLNTLKSKENSAVVNVNSISSYVSFPVAASYCASKAAAHSLTQSQRRDFGKSLVIGVYPGPIDTDMTKDIPFEKSVPSDVADRIVEALTEGKEDVFPDVMAVQLYEGYREDPKAVEAKMAASNN
eukprot:Nitzschia sp. Nitz4//scaffold43_size134323//20912//21649//NITZ4_003281-RA/size134323-processed-gene-0.27-mRNA-1//-1//CDS//3329551894//3261//frame0